MSYIQFQQRCEDCGAIWNASFGIVGAIQIAASPSECPRCRSTKIVHHANGWNPPIRQLSSSDVEMFDEALRKSSSHKYDLPVNQKE